MSDNKLELGDLVELDKDSSEWKHLEEKSPDHCLRGQGIVVEVRERKYVVRFGKWTAYLKESDLIKLTEER
tara:strand:- start:325 stop:537 length:213 start_codon:yes stop_codon:yes gene_type:complete